MSIIALLYNSINARSIEDRLSHEKHKNVENSDNFYVIFINNSILASKQAKEVHKDNKYAFASMIHEIHDLIVDNKNTFDNIEKFNRVNEKEINSSRKEIEEKYLMNEGDSNLVFPISSLKDQIILRAYLSTKLAKEIKSIDYVIDCIPYVNYIEYSY
ncbi:hypothetical protein H8356DRAFT_1004491 [Neocallimastix lanati (nom. inval.)]|nr:hypothetical protein H8356DRAFT_1004491 [Neocallimastix sp. JGI-2020a]